MRAAVLDARLFVVAEGLDVKLVTIDSGLLDRCPARTISIARFAGSGREAQRRTLRPRRPSR